MKVKVIEDSADMLRVELVGGSNTLANLLKEELYKDDKVLSAANYIKHPLTSYPQLIVRTSKGRTPKVAMKSALSRIEKESDDFITKFKKAL